jgi:hypothetical protein
MKLQSGSLFGLVVAFVWTIFMGVTAVGIGLGAAFPPINLVAKPFVCLNGSMRYEQTTSNPLPGTTYTQTAWYCVDDRTGEKTELGIFPMSLYSGVIYGLLLYGVGLSVWLFRRRGKDALNGTDQTRPRRQTAASGNFNDQHRPARPAPAGADAMVRMERLKELREANMISESEYQEKRAEILKDV